MLNIDIDFDVYKALTNRRSSEHETYNDVLRVLLGLKSAPATERPAQPNSNGEWVTKGVHFPNGTEFRATYKGCVYQAQVKDRALHLNGQVFNSPSAAAISITGTSVNGWIFWECCFPGQASWRSLKSIKDSKKS